MSTWFIKLREKKAKTSKFLSYKQEFVFCFTFRLLSLYDHCGKWKLFNTSVHETCLFNCPEFERFWLKKIKSVLSKYNTFSAVTVLSILCFYLMLTLVYIEFPKIRYHTLHSQPRGVTEIALQRQIHAVVKINIKDKKKLKSFIHWQKEPKAKTTTLITTIIIISSNEQQRNKNQHEKNDTRYFSSLLF